MFMFTAAHCVDGPLKTKWVHSTGTERTKNNQHVYLQFTVYTLCTAKKYMTIARALLRQQKGRTARFSMALQNFIKNDLKKFWPDSHCSTFQCLHSVFSAPGASIPIKKVDRAANFTYPDIVPILLDLSTNILWTWRYPNTFLRRFALSADLPDEWRSARVVLIFKKGGHLSLQYRHPICLTLSC